MTSSAREAFERLVDAVVCGRALPFVGAGVSRCAPYDGPGAKPTTEELEGRLAEHLWKRAQADAEIRKAVQGALGRRFRKAKALKSLGLSWLAEQVIQIEEREHRELCEILEIGRFCDLGPTRAHRYLAFLAREGLIDEVITTNYDRCLEKAFEESVGDGASPASSPARKSTCHVVTDHKTNAERFNHGRPVLTVYKVNGCSGCYDGKAESARGIALTERDLQAWHERAWAQRLFTDRLGQKAVILTGFGAEEAQVRFAIAALCEEFAVSLARLEPEKAPKQPNAPFVQEYRRELNRYQKQVLSVWFAAQVEREKYQTLPSRRRLSLAHSNAFTGAQRRFFGEKDGLTANRFWEAVFVEVWRRLLCRELETGVTAAFLAAIGLHGDEMAKGLIGALFDEGRDRCWSSSLLTLPESANGDRVVLPVTRCVEAVRGWAPGQPLSGRYFALGEQPLLIALTLLFSAWGQKASGAGVHDSPSNQSLGLRLPRAREEHGLEAWLAHSDLVTPATDRDETEDAMDLLFLQLVLFTDGTLYHSPPLHPPEVRQITETRRASDGGVYRRHGVRADARLLLGLAAEELRTSDPPGSSPWERFASALDRTVDRPWTWLPDHRTSYRTRTVPLGAA